jgi:hypothetical protein
MKQMIDDKKMEIETLRRVATGLQSAKGSYVAVKNDPVDEALAEVIN